MDEIKSVTFHVCTVIHENFVNIVRQLDVCVIGTILVHLIFVCTEMCIY